VSRVSCKGCAVCVVVGKQCLCEARCLLYGLVLVLEQLASAKQLEPPAAYRSTSVRDAKISRSRTFCSTFARLLPHSRCCLCRPHSSRPQLVPRTMESSRIFVRGLPPKFTEDDVRKHFAKFPVTDVKFFPHRRIGYVGYKTPDDAAKAVKYFNKTFIRMTKINVEIARPVSLSISTS
jgi:hypothetical protein